MEDRKNITSPARISTTIVIVILAIAGRQIFILNFIAWWLIGPMASKGTGLDFMGVHPEVVAWGIHWYYLLATVFLLGLAILGRWRQLRSL